MSAFSYIWLLKSVTLFPRERARATSAQLKVQRTPWKKQQQRPTSATGPRVRQTAEFSLLDLHTAHGAPLACLRT